MKRLLLLCLFPAFSSCNRQSPALEQIPTPVRVAAVEMYTPSQGQRYSASIAPNRQVNMAFRVGGFVESIYQVRGADGKMRSVDMGDVVRAGTVLAQLRTKDYHLQVSQSEGQYQQARRTEQAARGQLAQAQAAALKAQQDFGRADALFKENSLTKSDYDSAKENYDATRAQVETASAQVKASAGSMNTAQAGVGTAGLSLHDTSLPAPFTGTVVQRSIELGTLAGPSLVAFVLADISSVKATFGVPDTVIAHLKRGLRLPVYTEAFPSHQFEGFVSSTSPVADSSTRSFQVEVTLRNEQALLRPGMIASLSLDEAAKSQPVTVVPLNSIVHGNEESSQFAVLVVDGTLARRKPVTLGLTYGDRVAITGVNAGERVVSSGATFVSDGDTVRVIP